MSVVPKVSVPVCVVESVSVPVCAVTSVVPVCVVSRCVYTSVARCVLRRTHRAGERRCVRGAGKNDGKNVNSWTDKLKLNG